MARRTPLFDAHRALGARLVEFAGWEMPLCYRGAAEEHRAVRERCGLFDVSHMGEIELRGDRKSTRLNSSHGYISYAVFCLKKKKRIQRTAKPVRDECPL